MTCLYFLLILLKKLIVKYHTSKNKWNYIHPLQAPTHDRLPRYSQAQDLGSISFILCTFALSHFFFFFLV